MDKQGSTSSDNTLKNMNFLAWRVDRAKAKIHKDEVNRLFSGRARQRGTERLN